MSDIAAAWQRLPERLAGSRPEHRLQYARLGSASLATADPRLLAQLPAAPRPAAVLVGLIDEAAGPAILLTVRAAHLRQHASQISFPGGAVEPGEEPSRAALREAQEEVGLDPAAVTVLGYLPDQYVLTGFRITPVVGRLPPDFEARLEAREVAASFLLPFATLFDAGAQRPGTRRIAGVDVITRDLQYGEHLIWGATAAMLHALREVALR